MGLAVNRLGTSVSRKSQSACTSVATCNPREGAPSSRASAVRRPDGVADSQRRLTVAFANMTTCQVWAGRNRRCTCNLGTAAIIAAMLYARQACTALSQVVGRATQGSDAQHTAVVCRPAQTAYRCRQCAAPAPLRCRSRSQWAQRLACTGQRPHTGLGQWWATCFGLPRPRDSIPSRGAPFKVGGQAERAAAQV